MSIESTSVADLSTTAAFLHEVFSAERFQGDGYLRWYYRQNPVGSAVEIDREEHGQRIGHFAGIPQVLHSERGRLKSVILVDVSVGALARGRGLMSELHDACFEQARARGIDVVTGIANAPATPVYLHRLQYRWVTSLPALVCPPIWPLAGRVESRRVDRAYLEGAEFERLVASLDLSPTLGWSQRWTLELLRWRFASPGATYAIHVGSRLVVVTAVVRQHGIPITSVLKTFRRGRGSRALANGVIAAACRFHRSPAAIYAGFSAKCRVVGVPLPERLKPAPLNLIVRSTHPQDLDVQSMVFDECEFFDFDAF